MSSYNLKDADAANMQNEVVFKIIAEFAKEIGYDDNLDSIPAVIMNPWYENILSCLSSKTVEEMTERSVTFVIDNIWGMISDSGNNGYVQLCSVCATHVHGEKIIDQISSKLREQLDGAILRADGSQLDVSALSEETPAEISVFIEKFKNAVRNNDPASAETFAKCMFIPVACSDLLEKFHNNNMEEFISGLKEIGTEEPSLIGDISKYLANKIATKYAISNVVEIDSLEQDLRDCNEDNLIKVQEKYTYVNSTDGSEEEINHTAVSVQNISIEESKEESKQSAEQPLSVQLVDKVFKQWHDATEKGIDGHLHMRAEVDPKKTSREISSMLSVAKMFVEDDNIHGAGMITRIIDKISPWFDSKSDCAAVLNDHCDNINSCLELIYNNCHYNDHHC
jgi:hypothetical protein